MATQQNLPPTMQALVLDVPGGNYTAKRGFERRAVPTPTLDETTSAADAHNVILKTHFAGYCGSDKGLWFRNAFGDEVVGTLAQEKKEWRIPGHEWLGEVVQLGSAVRDAGRLKPGAIMSTESHVFCGECHMCRIGESHVCANHQIIGFSRDGGFAEYIKLPANVLWPTDTSKIRPEVGVLQEPFGNAVHVCSLIDLKDKSVLISGCGTIGLFTILVARNLGAKQIIAVDPDAHKLEYAKQLGADQVLPLTIEKRKGAYEASPELVAQVTELTRGVGVDFAADMAGFNTSLNNVIKCTRRGGHAVLFGIKTGDFILQNYDQLVVDGKTLHAVVGRRLFDTWERTQELLEKHTDTIQAKIYDIILNRGDGTIIDIADFDPDATVRALDSHIKVIMRFNG